MKKILLFSSALLVLATSALAQKKLKEGKVTYEISYPGLQLDPQQAAMLPTESISYIKNGRSRIENKMGMGMSTVTITDSKEGSVVTLIDMMGNKTALKVTKEQAEKEAEQRKIEKPVIKETNETKEVAGFKCKKAEVTDSKGNKSIVWYTPDIEGRTDKGQFKGISGFPMEFEVSQQGMTMKFVVKNVSEEKVPDEMFNIPPGYKEMTMDEFKKSMGGK